MIPSAVVTVQNASRHFLPYRLLWICMRLLESFGQKNGQKRPYSSSIVCFKVSFAVSSHVIQCGWFMIIFSNNVFLPRV